MKAPEGLLLTGGTGALGRAVADRFLADGYRVAVTFRAPRGWEELAARHPEAVTHGALLGIEADVTEEESVMEAVDRARRRLGDFRVLIHAAGGYAGGVPVEAVTQETVRQMVDLNLISAFWVSKHALPHLRDSARGRIVFVSSRGALAQDPGAAAYAAAKLGLHALVGTLAKELKGTGVTANAVLPSVIDTEANRAAMPGAPHETWVAPRSVASLLAYLASDDAADVSGALIPIYGRA